MAIILKINGERKRPFTKEQKAEMCKRRPTVKRLRLSQKTTMRLFKMFMAYAVTGAQKIVFASPKHAAAIRLSNHLAKRLSQNFVVECVLRNYCIATILISDIDPGRARAGGQTPTSAKIRKSHASAREAVHSAIKHSIAPKGKGKIRIGATMLGCARTLHFTTASQTKGWNKVG